MTSFFGQSAYVYSSLALTNLPRMISLRPLCNSQIISSEKWFRACRTDISSTLTLSLFSNDLFSTILNKLYKTDKGS